MPKLPSVGILRSWQCGAAVSLPHRYDVYGPTPDREAREEAQISGAGSRVDL